MFSASLGYVLDREADIHTVGIADSAKAALAAVATVTPDVILLDNRLPDGEGINLIRPLLDARPSAQIVMLTASTADTVLVAALEAGASGFIDKSQSLADLAAAIRAAAAGESLISPKILARLLPRLRRDADRSGVELTGREREVLALLASGLTNAEIAARMIISVHTARNHVANLLAKLGAHSKLEGLAIGVRQGLIARE
jgi:DNA-binding NarL/FixJ family response regulator